MYMGTTHMLGARGGQKRVLNLQKLKLQTIMNHCLGAPGEISLFHVSMSVSASLFWSDLGSHIMAVLWAELLCHFQKT